ncbi:MAG: histidinol-phosphate aminotransferase family protein [Gemmatimonadetes bacterium]|jgi:histidinol-phosphate aminotransferase|nr:histidinol-phosphate aminotransferase family protein [Gemmatimonadota bacterium]
MSLTRRGFARTVGLGTAGVLSSSFIIGRGREAAAFEPELADDPDDDGIIRISSNENARGPGPKAMAALHQTITTRTGRGYPPDHTNELVATIAEKYRVEEVSVVVGTGSGGLLEGAVRAFCSATKPLVTAAPTYGTPDRMARQIGAPVKMVPVDGSLALDLDAMADAASGAGMVFFCNPNNPTGTAHSASAVEGFVRRVMRDSPSTKILIDEAYIDYTFDPDVKTASLLTQEFPSVFITRSFSKAHGMAGLRVGYGIGHEETLDAITTAWNLGSMNTLSAAAAIASFKDTGHIDDERRENARIRDFTLSAFRDLGFSAADSHTNHIFVDLKRPASEFRDACLEQSVRVGRDFPPMEHTHCRISLGTMEEMETAVGVFRGVLS